MRGGYMYYAERGVDNKQIGPHEDSSSRRRREEAQMRRKQAGRSEGRREGRAKCEMPRTACLFGGD